MCWHELILWTLFEKRLAVILPFCCKCDEWYGHCRLCSRPRISVLRPQLVTLPSPPSLRCAHMYPFAHACSQGVTAAEFRGRAYSCVQGGAQGTGVDALGVYPDVVPATPTFDLML